jgi:hypothetical protein
MNVWRFSLQLLAVLIGSAAVSAQVPALINYQGRLLVGDVVFEGSGDFRFSLTDSSGSLLYWSNWPDLDGDLQPDMSVPLTVTRGIYSVTLGDTNIANMLPLSAQIFTNSHVYLRVWFDDGVHGMQQLKPDQRITSVGYALAAATVPDGAITMAKLAAGTLDASNLSGTLQAGQIPELHAAKITSGTFEPGRIPGLDTSQIASGMFAPERLPANLAYVDTDLASSSNALTAQISHLNSLLSDRISALGLHMDHLSNRLNSVAGQLEDTTPAGLTVVSPLAQDGNLIANGFTQFMTFPGSSWANGANADAPTARCGHSGVWTGGEWIIWGGELGSGYKSGAGSMYNPDLDKWRPVPPVDAPSPRSGHTAIWTGAEMIVWGGLGASGGFLGSGGRFQPGFSLWRALPLTGSPASRAGHIAVWTGSQMIVWGGRDSGGLLGDGALYDPALDRWTALNVAGAPAPRSGATAVWAGDRLIVWGGEGLSGPLDTGAQLLFNTAGIPFEWRTVSRVLAPPPRSGHTAVWMGRKMIVWGGRSDAISFGDGGAYDPAADIWTPVSALGAPSARNGHDALWTGREMLVVGGSGAAGAVASGAAYDPISDLWRELSSSGQPLSRSGASAAWTGSLILVFGGQAEGVLFSSLQSLNPQPPWHFYRKR